MERDVLGVRLDVRVRAKKMGGQNAAKKKKTAQY